MKTSNKSFFYGSLETLLLAVAIGILAVLAVKAEDSFNYDVLNGLFTPTQSDRFFQAGREDFEREVEFFNHPERYFKDDLLHIDPELIEQMNLPKEKPDFDREDAKWQLLLDVAE